MRAARQRPIPKISLENSIAEILSLKPKAKVASFQLCWRFLSITPAQEALAISRRAVADSRVVAKSFGKRHDDVLKAIRNTNCSPDFRLRNFAEFKIKDLSKASGESTSHVEMTRDGFAFVALGFTGAEAGAFKEKFIAAFNAMENRLRADLAPKVFTRRWRPDRIPAMKP